MCLLQFHRPLHDRIALGRLEADRLAGPFQVDARLRLDGSHLAGEHVRLSANLLVECIRGCVRQSAQVELKLAFLGHDVRGDAAADEARRKCRVGNGEAAIALLELREAIRDLADVHDEPRGVLDRIHAVRHVARMRLSAAHRAAKAIHPFMGDDGLHRGGLADHATGRLDAVLLQIADEPAHADAAHFLVIAQRVMDRALETPGVHGIGELRRLCQRNAR